MKFQTLFPLQTVINLDKRTDRLEICKNQEFPKLGINPIRKPGVLVHNSGNSYSNGVIGCALSHYEILQAALCLDTNVFIFEDDISFIGDDIIENLEMSCQQLENLDWDMFYISGNILKPCYQVSSHLAKLTHCQSTCGYGVNRLFVESLLKYIDLNNIKPIDVFYADDVIPNNNCFISIPMLGIQRDSFSDIEGVNVKYSDYLEKRYYQNLVRTS